MDPATAAERNPDQTKPAKADSYPEPPPETTATLEDVTSSSEYTVLFFE
jgi:hypothetical protein